MKFLRYITFLLSFLLVCTAVSVAQKFQFTGTVLNKETLAGVANVNISLVGTSRGCTSEINGEFSIKSDTLPVNMIVSHIGYKTQRVWLENDLAPFTVLLEPVAETLKEVTINAKNEPIPYYKDTKYSVLDYKVDQDLIFLLIYKYHLSRSELLCKSFYGDTLLPSLHLSFKPIGLFMDCLGYIHVLSKDSVYQVYLGKDSLMLIYPHSFEKFMATLEDCVASSETALYFRSESRDHQELEFFKIDRSTYIKTYIASVRDDLKMKMIYQNPLDYYYASTDTFPDSFQGMVEWMWVNQILYPPNESSLKKIGDSLCIFSSVDGTFEKYDLDGNFISDFRMPFKDKNLREWNKEIYVDLLTQKSYLAFEKYGKMSIYRIDLSTGNLEHVLTTSHTFPQRMMIHHDHLFYLYDLPGEGDNKQLYKQKL